MSGGQAVKHELLFSKLLTVLSATRSIFLLRTRSPIAAN